jgi:hypothetical protein
MLCRRIALTLRITSAAERGTRLAESTWQSGRLCKILSERFRDIVTLLRVIPVTSGGFGSHCSKPNRGIGPMPGHGRHRRRPRAVRAGRRDGPCDARGQLVTMGSDPAVTSSHTTDVSRRRFGWPAAGVGDDAVGPGG